MNIKVISVVIWGLYLNGVVCYFESASNSVQLGIIEPSLLQKLHTKSKTDIIISLKAGVSKAHAAVQDKSFEINAHKISALQSALISNAEESQKELHSLFKGKGHSFTSFWITNKMLVQNADLSFVKELLNLTCISEIREPIVASIPELSFESETIQRIISNITADAVQWGVKKIRADETWNAGNRGEGIIVGIIDTGVRASHRILRDNYVGDYGWFDSTSEKSQTPVDVLGHGTHCTGTILGKEGYGVAPSAKWMACLACEKDGLCYESALLECAQFMLCPTDPNGQNSDCSKAPNIVSNSWGIDTGGLSYFDDVIAAWHEARIIPVFAAGNAGPNCQTIGSPADRDVIAVGATTSEDYLSQFSSSGPTKLQNKVKPDLCAPGQIITSAGHTTDDSFAQSSGTSMATPHVAGALALLLAQNRTLTYVQLRQSLFIGAQKSNLRTLSEKSCGGIKQTIFPNNVFGNGRLDIVAAIKESKNIGSKSSGNKPGYIAGLITIICLLSLRNVFPSI